MAPSENPSPVPPASDEQWLNRFQHIALWLLIFLLVFHLGFVYFFRPHDSFHYPGLEKDTYVTVLFMTGLVAVLFAPDIFAALWNLLRPVAFFSAAFRFLQSVAPWLANAITRSRLYLAARRWLSEATARAQSFLDAHPYLRPAFALYLGLLAPIAFSMFDLTDPAALLFVGLAWFTHQRRIDERMLFTLALLLLLSSALLAGALNDHLRGEMSSIFLFYALVSILGCRAADLFFAPKPKASANPRSGNLIGLMA